MSNSINTGDLISKEIERNLEEALDRGMKKIDEAIDKVGELSSPRNKLKIVGIDETVEELGKLQDALDRTSKLTKNKITFYTNIDTVKTDIIKSWNGMLSKLDNTIDLNKILSTKAVDLDNSLERTIKNQLGSIFEHTNMFEAMGGDIKSISPELDNIVKKMREMPNYLPSNGSIIGVDGFKEILTVLDKIRDLGGSIKIQDQVFNLGDMFGRQMEEAEKVLSLQEMLSRSSSRGGSGNGVGGFDERTLSVLEEVRDTLLDISKTIGSISEDDGITSFVDAFKLVNENLDETITKLKTISHRVENAKFTQNIISDEGVLVSQQKEKKVEEIYTRTLNRRMEYYNKIMSVFSDANIEFPFTAIMSGNKDMYYDFEGDISGLEGLYSKAAIDGLSTTQEKLQRITEFLQLMNTYYGKMSGDPFWDQIAKILKGVGKPNFDMASVRAQVRDVYGIKNKRKPDNEEDTKKDPIEEINESIKQVIDTLNKALGLTKEVADGEDVKEEVTALESLDGILADIVDKLKNKNELFLNEYEIVSKNIPDETKFVNDLAEALASVVENLQSIATLLPNVDFSNVPSFEEAKEKRKTRKKKAAAAAQAEEEKAELRQAKKEDLIYHAGAISRLNKAETNGQFVGSRRDSGYYGTGWYFVSDKEKSLMYPGSSYKDKPFTSVDKSYYKLLKETDGTATVHPFSQELTRFTQTIISDYKEYTQKWHDEFNDEVGLGEDEPLKTLEEFQEERVKSLYEQYQRIYTEEGHVAKSYEEFVGKLSELVDYMQKSSMSDRGDSVFTQLNKWMGYEGVDTSGTLMDNTFGGTVIYDLKEESIIQANITDELQKQGDMLERINYEHGQMFDAEIDEKIQKEIDAYEHRQRILEKYNEIYDSSKREALEAESDKIDKDIDVLNDRIAYYSRSDEQIEKDIRKLHREVAEMFGDDSVDDVTPDEIKRAIDEAHEGYEDSVKELESLERRKEDIQGQLIDLAKEEHEAWEKAKSIVDSMPPTPPIDNNTNPPTPPNGNNNNGGNNPIIPPNTDDTIDDINDDIDDMDEGLDRARRNARELLDTLLEGRDIISQKWLRQVAYDYDSQGNITGAHGSFSFKERLQDGQTQRVLSTFNSDINAWEEEVMSLDTAFEQLGNEILSIDRQINKLEMDRTASLARNPLYDTSADDHLIQLAVDRRQELENTLQLYNDEYEYIYTMERFEERRARLAEELVATQEKANNRRDSQEQLRNLREILATNERYRRDVERTNNLLNRQSNIVANLDMTYDKSINRGLDKTVSATALTSLRHQRDDINRYITQHQNQAMTDVERRYLENLIADYKRQIKIELKANNPNKNMLTGADLKVRISEEIEDYKKLIALSEKFGTSTQSITAELKNWLNLLSRTDSQGNFISSVDEYYDAEANKRINRSLLNTQKMYDDEYKKQLDIIKAVSKAEEDLNAVRVKAASSPDKSYIQEEQEAMDKYTESTNKAYDALMKLNEMYINDGTISADQMAKATDEYQKQINYSENGKLKDARANAQTKLEEDATNANLKAAIAYERLVESANRYFELRDKKDHGVNTTATLDEIAELNVLEQKWKDAAAAKGDYEISVNGTQESQNYANSLQQLFLNPQQLYADYVKSIKEYFEKSSRSMIVNKKDLKYVDSYNADLLTLQDNIKRFDEILQSSTLTDDEKHKSIQNLIEDTQNLNTSLLEQTKNSRYVLASDKKAYKEAAKLSKYLRDNSAMSNEHRKILQGLRTELTNLVDSKGTVAEFDAIIDRINKFEAEIEEAGETGKNVIDRLFDSLKTSNAQLLAQYLSFQDIVRYAKSAVNTIKELDYALVDLKKTTAMTSSELDEFYYESSNIAKQLGVTTKEIIDQASAWSRLNKIGLLYGNI